MLKLNKHFLKEKIINSEGYSSQRRFEVKTVQKPEQNQSISHQMEGSRFQSLPRAFCCVLGQDTYNITLTLPPPGVY